MFFAKLATAVIIANTLVEATPAAQSSRHGVTFEQKATGEHKLRSGPIAMQAAYLKYGKPVPQNVKAAAAAAVQSGSVVATPQQYDASYLCPVQIGTPPQTLMLDFDTGSADFWVLCCSLPANERSGHSCYNPAASSTSHPLNGETFSINYGDGSGASGTVYADKVVIGGVTATSQAVECATSVSSEFVQDAGDGIVGFGFDSINTAQPNKVETWFDNVKATLPQPIFAAYLRHNLPGAYDFGYVNTSRYTGALTYVAVNDNNGFWEFTATGYNVGSRFYSASLDCIADTGTSLLYLPTSVVNTYYASVAGAQNSNNYGGYVFPCSSSLPNFGITIGGVSHTIPGAYMNYAPVSGSTCYGGLQSSAGIGFNILGDVFLKSQYVVFDSGNTRIGFAQQA